MRRILFTLLLAACADRARPSVVLYDRGDFAGAARAADDGLAQHPKDDDLWKMKVRAALALGDPDAVGKAYAGYVAAHGGDDTDFVRELSTATLRQALDSTSVKLKLIAIDAVQASELEALAEAVGERMQEGDERVKAAAAVAVLHAYPQAPQVASDMLSAENAEARRIAVDGIGKKVGKLALADLEKAANDPDPSVRAAALHWIGQLRDPGALELLAKRLKDGDAGVRAAAVIAFGRVGMGDVPAVAKAALADEQLAVRLAGLSVVKALGDEAWLVSLATDPDPLVAAEAAADARRPDLALPAIGKAAASSSPWQTRAAAANLAVRALGATEAKPVLVELAAAHEPAVALAAAAALMHANAAADGAPVLERLLADPDVGAQAAAELAQQHGDLGAKGAAALDAIIRAGTSVEARAAAARLCATAHRITPGLVAALADHDGVVRATAAAALAALSKEPAHWI
ncbi:MAG TPA: HEAT repeat domain-containing protein [Kofleriaceae bacterium]|jgi:HEAT repeat protein